MMRYAKLVLICLIVLCGLIVLDGVISAETKTGDDCLIPDSGPWPPCATGGAESAESSPLPTLDLVFSAETQVLSASDLVVFANKLYFSTSTGRGNAVWVTDGTTSGSSQLDLPWLRVDNPRNSLAVCGDKLFVSDDTGLWAVDATGTIVKVSDLGLFFAVETVKGCYFEHEHSAETITHLELWRSDGTLANTGRIAKWQMPTPEYNIPSLYDYAALSNGSFVFAKGHPQSAEESAVWLSDGFSATRFADGLAVIGVVGDYVLVGSEPFYRDMADPYDRRTSNVWHTYSPNGEHLYKTTYISVVSVSGMYDGKLMFFAADPSRTGRHFRITDGTPDGTRSIAVSGGRGGFGAGVAFDGYFYMNRSVGPRSQHDVWRYDGRDDSLENIRPASDEYVAGYPRAFHGTKDKLYFVGHSVTEQASDSLDWVTQADIFQIDTSGQLDRMTDLAAHKLDLLARQDVRIVTLGDGLYFTAGVADGERTGLYRVDISAENGPTPAQQPCPESGKWPAGCVPQAAPKPEACVIPESGPWPPCARQQTPLSRTTSAHPR